MKVFTTPQIQQIDEYTIKNEPIKSTDLMERAAATFVSWFLDTFPSQPRKVHVFCGIGNNGGDGLVAARRLHHLGYDVSVYACRISDKTSKDFDLNFQRLPGRDTVPVQNIREESALPDLPEGGIIVDAVFGSGLNRPVEGYWAKLLLHLNRQPCIRVAIDIPSGMFADKPTETVSFEADYTFSFEFPKLGFFFPDNHRRVGRWIVQSIGLHTKGIAQTDTPYHFVSREYASKLLRLRDKFSHKGTYGHALLLMGGYGKMGAAIMAGKAALRSGAGLISMHIPKRGYEVVQSTLPEAMAMVDQHDFNLTEIPALSSYNAVGAGCGLGQHENTQQAVRQLLERAEQPLVLDADALNIISLHPDWLEKLPKNGILTPHPKEFERLFGESRDQFARLELQRTKARELGVIIVLKGAYTCTATPDGRCFFNSTGNPGMATGGSGDVLAGMITGLLAQSYPPETAAVLGVYLHGHAGDLAAADSSEEAMIASDITEQLGAAFRSLYAAKA